ncbi:hypothetical protein [Iningainema tapete]|uniref:Uncharacterized protein n=1 Tax=Iningainema tapete BLCC-T55 TaxID=2748662 RepID=A0A8J7BYN5_9CYAN|nr:hypothetical protein [Iningainema tapete]MBD2776072.1 hypothetical protein [Iningainema tapete BLCC-T55]
MERLYKDWLCTFNFWKAFVAGKVDAVSVFTLFTTKALSRSGSKELFRLPSPIDLLSSPAQHL